MLEGTYSPSTNGELFPLRMIKDVDLIGVADSLVILNSEGGTVLSLANGFFNVSNITITGGSVWGDGGGIYCVGMSGCLKDIIMKNNHGDYGGGGIYMENSEPVLINLKITENTTSLSGSGLYCRNSDPILINSIICDNHGGLQGNGSAIALFGSNPTIINSTIANNKDNGIYCQNNSNPVLINTVLWGHEVSPVRFGEIGSGNSITSSYSDIEWGEEAIVTNNGVVYWLEGNIDNDPLFPGGEAHPYSLSDFSPCIDAGTPDTNGLNMPLWDITGNYRMWDGNLDGDTIVDMGAYEYGAIPFPIGVDERNIQHSTLNIHTWPNPTYGISHFAIYISQYQYVTLKIYDLHGRELAVVLDKKLPSGEHAVRYDMRGLPGGIYLVRLQAGQEVATGKVLKIN